MDTRSDDIPAAKFEPQRMTHQLLEDPDVAATATREPLLFDDLTGSGDGDIQQTPPTTRTNISSSANASSSLLKFNGYSNAEFVILFSLALFTTLAFRFGQADLIYWVTLIQVL